MHVAHLQDAALSYRRVGSGDDLVLIHGLAANHAFWHLDVLLPLAREWHATVFDLRGHGHSTMPKSGYTSADLAEDLRQLLDHLQIERAHLVGHSLGGVVALHFATLWPERVRSLTVADSRVRALQPSQRPADWPNWRVAKQRFAEVGLDVPDDVSDWGIWLLEQLASPEWRAARDRLAGTALFIPFSRWGGGNRSAERWLELLNQTTARRDFAEVAGLTREALAGLSCPLLAMYGEKSTTLPSLAGLESLVPDCRSVVVPEAGHFFPLSCSELFVATVREFLRSVPSEPVHESGALLELPSRDEPVAPAAAASAREIA